MKNKLFVLRASTVPPPAHMLRWTFIALQVSGRRTPKDSILTKEFLVETANALFMTCIGLSE